MAKTLYHYRRKRALREIERELDKLRRDILDGTVKDNDYFGLMQRFIFLYEKKQQLESEGA